MAATNIELIVSAVKALNPLRQVDSATKKLSQTVKRTQTQLNGLAKRAGRVGDKMRAAFAKAQKAAEKFQSKLKGLKGTLLGLGAAALTKRMIGQAASFAQTQVRLKALSSEYGEFGKIQKLVKDNAKTFNQSQAESASNFADVFARLRPLGTSLEDIQTVYKGFNATALASGTSAAAASGAFLQLSQALGSGRLQGDEFRSIAEQVPGILRLVSDEMGVTVGELKQLGSDGKITSDILINSLAKGFEENKDKIQQLLDESPAQKFKEFSNATSELSNSIGTELLPVVTPTVEGLTEMVGIVGKLPAPMRTLAAAGFGLAAAFTAASGAANLLGIKLKVMLALAGKIALFAAPLVALGLVIEDARLRKEEFDKAMESTSPTVLEEALDKANKELDQLSVASKKYEDSPYYKGKIQDVNDLKTKLDEAKLKVEELTKRRTLVIDLILESKSIAEDVRRQTATGRPGGAGFDTLTPEQLDEALGRSKPKPTGKSPGVDPSIAARENARAELQAIRDQVALAKTRTEQETRMVELQQRIRDIDASRSLIGDDLADKQIQEERGLYTILEIKEAIAKKTRDNAKAEADATARFLSDFDAAFAQRDAQLEAQAEKMDQLYSSIGNTITTGIVDSLTAAVEGTKSLAEVASDTLRSLGNILLKFGLNSFLSGLGGDDGIGFFSKLFPRANGGSVMSSGSYLVGEKGPELFTPGRSGSIAPNGALGGGANVTVNVDASGSSVEGDSDQASQLGKMLGAAVQAELIKQKRPGGLLSS